MPYKVSSYHLNVDEGDCAIHVLKESAAPKSIVLIDGGRESYGAAILNFMESQVAEAEKLSKFNAVIITHWDADHIDGILEFLVLQLQTQVKNEADTHEDVPPRKMKKLLQDAANKGKFKLALLTYIGMKPTTRFYVPYWDKKKNALSEHSTNGPENYNVQKETVGNGNTYLRVLVSGTTKEKGGGSRPFSVWVRVGLLGPMGDDLLGFDFFTGKKLNIQPDPDSPKDVSKFLYDRKWEYPAMYCMGCDGISFSPEERKTYQWTDTSDTPDNDLATMKLRDMVLRESNANSDDVSATLVKGATTANNGCSIACMVIWPDDKEAKVSHYFAGDSGDQEEEQFLRWATVETSPNSGIRKPIRIDTVKLSHHGGKFSTPVRMLFLWRPSTIIVSNSMNSSWKHPAWELVMCLWLYYRWRKVALKAGERILLTTNFPIYLVKWWDQEKNGTADMSIGSLASLKSDGADELFDLWDNLRQGNIIPKTAVNPRKVKGGDENKKKKIARTTAQNWDGVSAITKGQYTGRADDKWPAMKESEKQRIRVILVVHIGNDRRVLYYPGSTMGKINPAIKRVVSYARTFGTTRQLSKTLGRDETQCDVVSENRYRRTPIPQKLSGLKTIQNLIKDDEISEKLTGSNGTTFTDPVTSVAILKSQGNNSVKDLQLGFSHSAATGSEVSPNGAGLYFLTASNTVINREITKYLVKEGQLDCFVGDLQTGAIVLAAEPPVETASPLSMTPLHETDESYEWLIFCLGNRDDPQCALRAGAAVTSNRSVNIMGFELETKLKYVGDDQSKPTSSPFFEKLVKFSTANNAHAFNITGTRWPIMSANVGDADAVGPAHIVCMSLGESSGPSSSTVKVSEILSMFNFTPNEFLSRLANVADLELDPAKGAKNSIWYTPAEKHETTLRLCFKQSNTQGVSLLDTVKGVINTVTGVTVNTPPQMSMEPRLIVKKTWTLPYEDDVDVEIRKAITVLLELEFPGKNTKMQLETALTFEQDKVEWVLHFRRRDSFMDILSFIANIFGVDQLATDIKQYLPKLNDIMVRQVTYTHETDVKTIEVVLQVDLGGMIMLCTLHVDILPGGSNLEFSGSLFPESRTQKLGDSFFWVPYSSHVDSWNSLEIAPLVNSAGVLEDVPATEVGDLRKTFNALRANDQEPLETSPTSLELVGLNFALSQEEVIFSATVMTDTPNEEGVPAIKLLAASLDLRYDIKGGKVSNCSLATSLPLLSPVPGIPPAVCNLSLTFNNPTWTLKGGLLGVRGSLLYSLFDQTSNEEMAQLLSNVIFSLQLTYEYDGNAKASSFSAKGILKLGRLIFAATYDYPKNREWTFAASLNVLKDDETQKEDSLLSVIGSLCGKELTDILPAFVGNIPVKPVGNTDLSSLKVVKLEKAILVLVRLQITATTSIAFYQYQYKRENTKAKAPAVKRALVFSLSQLPSVDNIPLIGSLKQPFDEARFMWIGGGDDKGWKEKEVQVLNDEAAKLGKDYPQMIFKKPGQQGQTSSSQTHTSTAGDPIVLKGGFHLCLIQNGEIRLDHVFGATKAGEKDVSSEHGDDDDSFDSRATTSPLNKTMGPVTITGIGVAVDVEGEKLKIIIDGTVKLGPIDLTLIGFSLGFDLKGVTLTTLDQIKLPTFRLDGLAVGFQKDPITIAGLFERQVTADSDLYLGGAIVGFKEWRLEAGGYYGMSKAPAKPESLPTFEALKEEEFKAFLAYFRVSGPIATIGYAEIRGVVGGFGYNTSVRIPTMQDVQNFPFLAQKQEATPSKALEKMLSGGWFSNKQGQNWVAAGMTILAFQMLTVSAVVLVEWGSGVKLGIFGLATAEMPKHLPKKFAVVQLGVVATVDFDAGIMKVDGQLTPASFVLDPSCHLTGGFALYAWFGHGAQQGDWVFTIGGYHPSYQKPEPYPNPPRLGINWSYNSSINIVGGAYFAITPKMIMGGGSLHVTLSLGSLYAYLDAFADFLINYQPFMYRASGGITVGVHYTLDLWLVSIPINVNLGAIITFQGPPLSGQVYVNFYVFAFKVEFGTQQSEKNDPISLLEFEKLVRQTTPKTKEKPGMITDGLENENDDPLAPPHILNCISGLVPNGSEPPKPESPWVVRGAIFAFTVSCKFAIQTASIITLREQDGELVPDHTEPVKNDAVGKICAKPMQRGKALGQSFLEVSITPPPLRPTTMDELNPQAANPAWNKYDVGYSNLPTALWGAYDESQDPAKPGNDPLAILNNSSDGTTQLLTSLTLYSPPSLRAKVSIARFNVAKSMGLTAGKRDAFPPVVPYHDEWLPLPTKKNPEEQYGDVKVAWDKKNSPVREAARFMANLGLGGWEWPEAASEKKDEGIKIPERFIGEMKQWWIEPPVLCT